MLIKGFVKTSYVDYPGRISSVIFLAGCNFRCKYCYNKDLVSNAPSLAVIPKSTVFGFLEKRRNVLEGICVTGGEPTVNPDLIKFLLELRQFGLPIKLDTNGTNPNMLLEILSERLVDYIALDIKAPLSGQYQELTDCVFDPVEKIKESLRILTESGISFELRTTVIPQFHSRDSLVKMVDQVDSSLGSTGQIAVPWYFQPFVSGECISEEFNNYNNTSKEYLDSLVSIVSSKAILAKVR